MDGERFDQMTLRLGDARTRRGLLRKAAALGTFGLAAFGPGDDIEAGDGKKRRRRRRRKARRSQCKRFDASCTASGKRCCKGLACDESQDGGERCCRKLRAECSVAAECCGDAWCDTMDEEELTGTRCCLKPFQPCVRDDDCCEGLHCNPNAGNTCD